MTKESNEPEKKDVAGEAGRIVAVDGLPGLIAVLEIISASAQALDKGERLASLRSSATTIGSLRSTLENARQYINELTSNPAANDKGTRLLQILGILNAELDMLENQLRKKAT
jgi:hypothetical protein